MSSAPPPPPSMAASREPHVLALKVLRASRPSLAPSITPYSEDSSLGGTAISELNANSIEHASQFAPLTGALLLPSNFGTIFLGETFSAILSLSNDLPSTSVALSPVLKVEMHTTGPGPAGAGGSKHHLKTVYAPSEALGPGESVEGMVSHEIKELGMHALVCTITYGARPPVEEGLLTPRSATNLSRSFRKVYKFQVSNPLSVRTKAHAPSPLTASSSLSPVERQKVFLEVQVQNQGENAMSFERMHFDPVPGWTCVDINTSGLFEGASALLDPSAVRQYLYVLSQAVDAERAVPGSSQPLGRLDIIWRTPNGEIGRLQTSMLGRRVPLLAPTNLPLEVAPEAEKSLPGPPQTPVRTGPAPYRPQGSITSPQSASTPSFQSPVLPSLPPTPIPLTPDIAGLDFDLTVLSITPSNLVQDQPFTIRFSLQIKDGSSPAPKSRRVHLFAQHVQYHDSPLLHARSPSASPIIPNRPQTIISLPSTSTSSTHQPSSSISTNPTSPTQPKILLPKPLPLSPQPPNLASPLRPTKDLISFGSSTKNLGEIHLKGVEAIPEGAEASAMPTEAKLEFEMRYLPLTQGLLAAGGVRILVGRSENGEEDQKRWDEDQWKARVVLEIEKVSEVWVRSRSSGK